MQRSWQEQDVQRFLGREAPRYTSYPSAHHFGAMPAVDYETALGSLQPEQSLGLYLHVPFCEQMCYFCGCNTHITKRYSPVTAYVESLVREIHMVGEHLAFRPNVHSIHFGGGSPGILSPEDMAKLFDALNLNFSVESGAEISIELDPRRITPTKVQSYAAVGFNRVSLGVQDTNLDVQRAINRIQPIELIEESVKLLRSYGLKSIGIDLIYGLPLQTLESLAITLTQTRRLEPTRISAFSYAHVPWMKKHQTLIDRDTLPTTEDKVEFFILFDQTFQEQGYRAIGIDHFALPDDGLSKAHDNHTLRRNFMGYTDQPNDRLLAFGASAISELDGGIFQNIPQSTTYQNTINQAKFATTRGWLFGGEDRLRKAIIAELMCYFEIDIENILIRHNLPCSYLDEELAHLDEYISAGVVTVQNRKLVFHSPLRMLIRSVASVFDRHNSYTTEDHRYSKVA
ncbi:MAG: oxygen-independent coproporphyrinogen III oxidase [Asticcacaulis sp. 32-58-5]|nr:MAG: oxygen-independent coproporphyrinogen III oxidase [Asticcacaulis sp. 32-58-5]